ncbi:MAG: 2,3-bisphosphoglycerate-dependent phosphoglycerate mutase [Chlorobi bacterium]|nr:2,3-bisphosphoglycerate-dependent phosphoglycerate mutase [Chlorobiota bacterium]
MAKLVLLRHGESVWNKMNVFTGWVDVPLSTQGITEAKKAGEQLQDFSFDIIFTSTLVRAMETAMICMAYNQSDRLPVIIHNEEGKESAWAKIYDDNMEQAVIPVIRDWHLNERYYGELQGKNKAKTAEQYGDEQVHLWRRSYDVPPPNGESLKDTAARTIPFFKDNILPRLKENQEVFVAAHGNSLRSIVMYLENLTEAEVLGLEIPTGKPILYDYTGTSLQKVEI